MFLKVAAEVVAVVLQVVQVVAVAAQEAVAVLVAAALRKQALLQLHLLLLPHLNHQLTQPQKLVPTLPQALTRHPRPLTQLLRTIITEQLNLQQHTLIEQQLLMFLPTDPTIIMGHLTISEAITTFIHPLLSFQAITTIITTTIITVKLIMSLH